MGKLLIVFLVLQRIALIGIVYILLSNQTYFKGIGFFEFIEAFVKRWDANGYQFIAQYGYVNQGEMATAIVFPPLYPLLMRLAAALVRNFTFAGFLVSNLFFLIGSLVFYRLLRYDNSEKFSFWAVTLLAFFPTSFFFSIGYPESVFFTLFVLTLLSLRKNNFLLAATFAGLATLTRPFGTILWPALFSAWYFSRRRLLDFTALIITMFLSVGIYLLINYSVFGDPFAFKKMLLANWQKQFEFPWVGIMDSWKRGIYTPEWGTYKILVGYVEGFTSTVAWAFIPLAFLKRFKLDPASKVYYLLSVFLFTSTTFILSAPRYLLSIPPFFVVLARLTQNTQLKIVILLLFSVLLVHFAFTIAQGQWAF